MDANTIISLAAMLVALFGFFMNGRKDTRSDAAENAITQTKLDNLINGVDDIRIEMRSIQKEVRGHGDKILKIEARIDHIEKSLQRADI